MILPVHNARSDVPLEAEAASAAEHRRAEDS